MKAEVFMKVKEFLNEINIKTDGIEHGDHIEIDSIQIIELILKLEEFYEISISPSDSSLEKFSSIDNITKLICKYTDLQDLKKNNEDFDFYI